MLKTLNLELPADLEDSHPIAAFYREHEELRQKRYSLQERLRASLHESLTLLDALTEVEEQAAAAAKVIKFRAEELELPRVPWFGHTNAESTPDRFLTAMAYRPLHRVLHFLCRELDNRGVVDARIGAIHDELCARLTGSYDDFFVDLPD